MTKSKKDDAVEDLREDGEEERGTWGNQCEFFLSCLGYAVGFGNVWRFPYLCYKNGGGAFLIPYVIMLLIAGLPLFFLDLALGQYASLGPNIIFLKLAPVFHGLGWGMIFVSLLVAIYYNMILAWTFFYTFNSFQADLPWGSCDNDFNTKECYTAEAASNCTLSDLVYYNKECLEREDYCAQAGMSLFNATSCRKLLENGTEVAVTFQNAIKRISASEDFFKNRMLRVTGRTWEDMGAMNWEMVGCLALSWLVVGLCLIKGVKSSGKVVYFTALFPYAVLVILFIRGVTLDGAIDGIKFYITPDVSRLSKISVWGDAATQIFYSLGSSFGGLITLASYNKFKNNCMRDAIVIAFSNCATSVFAGLVIFSILGSLAYELGVDIDDVVQSGSGLAFVAYPAAVVRMPIPPLWSILFFTMLITLGLDSQFTMVETVTTAFFDQFKSLRERKPLIVMLCAFIMFLLGLTMCLEGGIYMFELFNNYSAGISIMFLAVVEIIVVMYVYGFRNFLANITDEMTIYVPGFLKAYWIATWVVLTPLALLIIIALSFYNHVPPVFDGYEFPVWSQVLGWFLCFSSVAFIPAFAIYHLCVGKMTGLDLITPAEDWGPAHVRKALQNGAKPAGSPDHAVFKYTYDNEGFAEGRAKVYPRISNGQDEPPAYKETTETSHYM